MPRPFPVVCLVGMPGSGKSTVAPLLAARLGVPSDDLDRRIVDDTGMDVAAIFGRDGEEGFRARERDALTAFVESDRPMVLSTGGGVVTCDASRRLLARTTCVWLTASRERLAARVDGSDEVRPMLAGDLDGRLASLGSEREPLYREVATFVVDTDDLDADATAAAVAELLA
jgi:shikimate kinase